MSRPPRLPTASSLNRPQAEYPPYPDHPAHEWLERSLEQMMVRGVTAILYKCAPKWAMPTRRISDDMLFYVIKGRGRMTVQGRTHPLFPGICASFQRGVEHAAFHDPGHPIHVISLHYTATVFESLTVPDLLGFPNFFQVKGDAAMDAMMREACREHALRPPGWERGLESLTTRILLHLIREHGGTLSMKSQDAKFADLRRLLPSLESMKGNLAALASVPALARSAGYSEAQFRRVFARAMGMAPVQYMRRIRMERAGALLRTTSQTIESISAEVGYAEPAFFAHSFKKLMGIAPGEYRRRHEL